MGRPLHFEFLRDTPNYRLFTAQSEELGKDVNLWLPHHALTNIDKFSGYVSNGNVRDMGVFPDAFRVHTDLPEPSKEVLYRKVVGPDNKIRFYPIAPDPTYVPHGTETGRFRTDPSHFELPRGSYHTMNLGYDVHRRFAKLLKHAEHYRSDFRWADGGTDHDQIKKLIQRVYKLETRQGILFRAIEKILKRLHWIKE